MLWGLSMIIDLQRWAHFRRTKTYDVIVAIPLFLWYGLALRSQLPFLSHHLQALFDGTLDIKGVLQLSAVLSSALFFLVIIYFLIARVTPVSRSKGLFPRIIAVMGTFVGSTMLYLPVANLSLPTLIISNMLILVGSAMAIVVMSYLGQSFAIIPEARKLTMSGPYALVRHPLYVVEVLIMLGAALEFQQPWSMLILITVLILQYCRTIFEERVLEAEYPQYRDYKRRTPRFIPGLY